MQTRRLQTTATTTRLQLTSNLVADKRHCVVPPCACVCREYSPTDRITTHINFVVRAGLVGRRLKTLSFLRSTIYLNDFSAPVTIGRTIRTVQTNMYNEPHVSQSMTII
ncbi:hypothetical protein J6590_025875 [Homalodisca vitripennis]|nr:hypothetical protein J6590_025875 [Homalodisca vitripennis]